MKDIEPIKKTLDLVIDVLNQECSQNWRKHFLEVRSDLDHVDNDKDLIAWSKRITGVYGGMGSFNDLVLQKGNDYLKIENNILSALKAQLFDQALNFREIKSEQA